ncbi:AraC family transcriptional regulator [Rhizobium oryziradicis]|uniref:AraC family transcriptional regulator n=1 Tax=Rhizobium oryziradicis TaxID=1867956 RepID=A0A1Q8ZPC2_9HYPH|nr:AraC family transcriptional regulator [Rhizobium oryziradicis]OLP43751.1 AraC family transcriptional regulator [Rhizobium oryziradicis]
MHTVCLDRVHPSAVLPAPREATAFWRDPHFGGMECMSATFITHRFSPHAHEHFGLGAMETGLKLATIRGCKRVCGPGDLYLINPEEVHDGSPVGGIYRYRMIYPSVAMVRGLLEEFSDCTKSDMPFFPEQIVCDPALANAFNHAHRLMQNRAGALEEEEGMLGVLVAIFARHSQLRPAVTKTDQDAAVARARDYLHAHFADDVGLAQLAAIVGTSRAHLIRSFRAAFHITPHAYLTSLRIRAAQKQLSEGHSPIEVAFACGFADQAHFTRNFKARTGMTPAQFRRG